MNKQFTPGPKVHELTDESLRDTARIIKLNKAVELLKRVNQINIGNEQLIYEEGLPVDLKNDISAFLKTIK